MQITYKVIQARVLNAVNWYLQQGITAYIKTCNMLKCFLILIIKTFQDFEFHQFFDSSLNLFVLAQLRHYKLTSKFKYPIYR